jgi:hypothetical protein
VSDERIIVKYVGMEVEENGCGIFVCIISKFSRMDQGQTWPPKNKAGALFIKP